MKDAARVVAGLTIALLSVHVGQAGEPQYRVQVDRDRAISLLVDGKPLWTLHYAQEEGKPYFHPVCIPDGTRLTWLRPPDHRWHRAIWFSWKHINGLNYWEENKQGQPQGRTVVVALECKTTASPVRIAMDIEYRPPGQPPVLKERRVITASLPADDGSYHMDWAMTFTAQGKDVVFDRTKTKKEGGPAWGGYAGLSYRAVKGMTAYQTLDSEGRKNMAGHGRHARWLDFSGVVDAKTKQAAGIALFDHPDNPRHPTPMYIIMRGHFGYCSPAFLFDSPYTLPAGKSFTLFYRMLIHPGRGDKARMDQEYKAFAALKHPAKS